MSGIEAYEVIDVIGKGTFGTVSKIRRKEDNKILVWKEINYGKMGEKEKKLLVQEVNLLQKLKHPYIVNYYDRIIDRDNTTLFIVMEYCSNGDLASLIKKCRKERVYFDEEIVWKVATQIVLALAECHKHKDGVVSQPGNIFMDAEKNVKLGDFGLARVLGQNELFANTFVGTPYYMSPEQINGLIYNDRCDIWSFGCLIYEMASLSPPFEAPNQAMLQKKIVDGRYIRIPDTFSEDLYKLIQMTLNTNKHKRASIDDLLAYPPLAWRIKEKKLAQLQTSLKKKEEDLRRKEIELMEREQCIKEKERELAQIENLMESVNVMRKPLAPSNLASCKTDVAPAKDTTTLDPEEKENTLATFGKVTRANVPALNPALNVRGRMINS